MVWSSAPAHVSLIANEEVVVSLNVFVLLLCDCLKIYNKALNLLSFGKLDSLFALESWCFPRLRLRKHRDSRENKNNCFPQDHTLSVWHFLLKQTLYKLSITIVSKKKEKNSLSKQSVAFTPKSHDNKVHDLQKLLVANTANSTRTE